MTLRPRNGPSDPARTRPLWSAAAGDSDFALDDRASWPLVPGYEIVSELGRGGAAVVYLARQTALNRLVALKVLLGGALATASDRERFRREAEAAAKLDHPNVIQIHDIGEHGGSLYLSLEYAPGGSLDRRLKKQPLAPAEAAALVEQLAAGVQAAHDAGVVHRDLKPPNVLLAADGTPKVSDFGLAQQSEHAVRLTRTGMVAGTPSYMAPEQVLPEPHRIGPGTDVYGLGTILYECLTGRPPFAAPTTLETMRRVADDEAVSVRRLQRAVPRDLETICRKCLNKDPDRRYPTARALADDLARFRAGEPIHARPAGAAELAWLWARRNPVVPLLALTLGLMTLAVAGLMARTTYHAYQVAGHLRERELYLHGLRGTLLQLDEAQARHAELAAATGGPHRAADHERVRAEGERLRADAARLAPQAAADAGLDAAAARVAAAQHRALERVAAGRPGDGWQVLQGDEYRRARDEYAAAVNRFADRVDAAADAELRQVQAEGLWSLASATAVAALLSAAAVAAWLLYLRPPRRAAPDAVSAQATVLVRPIQPAPSPRPR